jgi:uncharacterized protein YggE
MSKSARRICLLLLGLVAFVRPCAADDNPPGITVTGEGTVKARPSTAEILATVTGEGELAADANVKYADARKKAVDAINAMNNPDLSVELQGPVIEQATDPAAQMRMMNGMGTDNGKQQVRVSESMKVLLKNIDKLDPAKLVQTVVKIVDAGRDAGLQVGPAPAQNYYQLQMQAQSGTGSSIVTFELPDKSKVEEEAYQKAVEDARTKAQRIADLSGVKLGRVLSVTDQETAGNAIPNPYINIPAPPDDKQLQTAALTEIPVNVRLIVRFEIDHSGGPN